MPRKEVREGRSFNPDEFAIALEQVVAGSAPRTIETRTSSLRAPASRAPCASTRAWCSRRLSGQDGQHRTGAHADHPVRRRQDAHATRSTTWRAGTRRRVTYRRRRVVARGRPTRRTTAQRSPSSSATRGTRAGRETPWIDIARQLAGDPGVAALGFGGEDHATRDRGLARVFQAAGAPVLLLFDEVLNYLNRHRGAPTPSTPSSRTSRSPRPAHPRRVRDQPAAQPGGDDRVGHAVAGQDLEGRASRRQGPDRQRRDRDQRGRPAAAL